MKTPDYIHRDDHQIDTESDQRPAILVKGALKLYDMGWRMSIPVLQRNRRLREGYTQRCLRQWAEGPIDLWIHGASAGESYLAAGLIQELRPAVRWRILLTTLTSQGMGILLKAKRAANGARLDIQTAYFPFDSPTLMRHAVAAIRPRLAVLLETELWPGYLSALKAAGVPILIVNGRLTPKSFAGYRRWPALWQHLCPTRILAVSKADARRYGALFPASKVELMPNIKFDRLSCHRSPYRDILGPAQFLADEGLFLVLGSIRRQEEPLVARMIPVIRRLCPKATIGLFPRHMHRLSPWRKRLDRLALPWHLRTGLKEPVSPGTVVLWDTFGELSAAYDRCQACFIGGSLAPLGGQNFLEPLAHGVMPVIGPHWDNFAWIGREIVTGGLVREVQEWREAAEMLAVILENPPARQLQKMATRAYLQAKSGGTAHACRAIEAMLTRTRRRSSASYSYSPQQ